MKRAWESWDPGRGLRLTGAVLALAAVAALGAGKTGPQCTPIEPEVPVYEQVEVWYDTDGGFAGHGTLDVRVADWTVRVHDPLRAPDTCETLHQTEWMDRLAAAANAVDWDGVAETYVSPENPHCCCDQLRYTLTVGLTTREGATRTVETSWCDESRSADRLPADLLEFLDAVLWIGDSAFGHCGA